MTIYRTRLKMKNELGTPVLNITMSGKNHYPATFTNLSVQVVVEPVTSYREHDPDFFLDFPTALPESYDGKPKQMQLLEDFESAACDEVLGDILGNPTIFKKTKFFTFESDSGLETSNKRYGNPKSSKSSNAPLIRKKLTSF